MNREELADLKVGATYEYVGTTHRTTYLVIAQIPLYSVHILILDSLGTARSDAGSLMTLHRGSKWALESTTVS